MSIIIGIIVFFLIFEFALITIMSIVATIAGMIQHSFEAIMEVIEFFTKKEKTDDNDDL